MNSKYYLTTPLYYVNSKPHIGHSYTEIAADTLARFHRLRGDKVLFLTGTDEHGQKVDKAAQAAGLAPAAFTDKISESFKELWQTLNISYDDFIRTTEPRHIAAVQAVWIKLHEKNEIRKDIYRGLYCTPCESFWLESQVIQTPNIVGAQRAVPLQCPDCKRPVESLEEENYFLALAKHQAWLIQYIRDHKGFILPETRRNEVLGFLENNTLQDLCISRPKSRLSWGIPSPISENHVTYVWFDALINYISACGYPNEKKMSEWWPADAHIIGKDILRHHAVYWTILLKALDLPLPKMIFAHGWWVQGGEKMSKSRGNVVDPVEIVKRYGVDPYRYFLLRETPFGEDGTFSEEALIKRFNIDLANDLGNLLSRSLTMCEKYFQGYVPEGDHFKLILNNLTVDEAIKDNSIKADPFKYKSCHLRLGVDDLARRLPCEMGRLAFSESLQEIWLLINKVNKYIEDVAPWTLSKEGKTKELKLVISSLCEVMKVVAQALWLFMPTTGERIWAQLGLSGKPDSVPFDGKWGFFEKGGKIAKGAPLFPRIEIKTS